MPNTRSNTIGSTRTPIAGIVLVSAAAVLFLLWLIYVHPPPPQFSQRLLFLPALNSLLNGLSAIALVAGFIFIRRHQISRHRAAMITAFIFSSLFIVSYLTDHALHGDILYPGHSAVRTLYLAILASHIVLSMVALPIILITFYFSLSGRFPQHRKIARYTFPIWLYVSVTGVVVYALLSSAR